MFIRRLFPALLGSVVLAAVAVAPVAAASNGPERVRDTVIATNPQVWAECDGFDVVLEGLTIERTFLLWKDADGEVVLERRHVYFHGPMVNSVTGASAEYIGRFTRVVNTETDTEALIGLSRMIHLPGTGVVSMAAGHIGWDLTLDEEAPPIFDNGQSLFQFEAEVADALCAALD